MAVKAQCALDSTMVPSNLTRALSIRQHVVAVRRNGRLWRLAVLPEDAARDQAFQAESCAQKDADGDNRCAEGER